MSDWMSCSSSGAPDLSVLIVLGVLHSGTSCFRAVPIHFPRPVLLLKVAAIFYFSVYFSSPEACSQYTPLAFSLSRISMERNCLALWEIDTSQSQTSLKFGSDQSGVGLGSLEMLQSSICIQLQNLLMWLWCESTPAKTPNATTCGCTFWLAQMHPDYCLTITDIRTISPLLAFCLIRKKMTSAIGSVCLSLHV